MKREFTIEDARENVELFELVRGLLKRVEALEKLTGISRQDEIPCVFCNVKGAHQKWCQKDANRPSGT